MLIWTIWSATEILTSRLPGDLAVRTTYVRVFLIGLTLRPPTLPSRHPTGATHGGHDSPLQTIPDAGPDRRWAILNAEARHPTRAACGTKRFLTPFGPT
jgi:hypothetical protein